LNQADASRILARLKAAFPVMTLDEEQAEVLLREVTLLHDAAILDEAVGYLIHREERFPTIARIRLSYRSVAEAHATAKAALERAAEPAGDRDTPEWVQVWSWWREKTLTERQAANGATHAAVGDRPPVRMRDFPQFDRPGSNAYTPEDYEKLRQGWVKAGSPKVGGVVEIAATTVGGTVA
jgi:hypothetical protein